MSQSQVSHCIDDEILGALHDFGTQLAQGAPGSPERVQGVVICGVVRELRQIRQECGTKDAALRLAANAIEEEQRKRAEAYASLDAADSIKPILDQAERPIKVMREAEVVFCHDCGLVTNRPTVYPGQRHGMEDPWDELVCPECGETTSSWVKVREVRSR